MEGLVSVHHQIMKLISMSEELKIFYLSTYLITSQRVSSGVSFWNYQILSWRNILLITILKSYAVWPYHLA